MMRGRQIAAWEQRRQLSINFVDYKESSEGSDPFADSPTALASQRVVPLEGLGGRSRALGLRPMTS